VKPHRPTWHRSFPAVALGTVITVAVLYLAKPVIVPLALALLLTFVLSPVVAALQRAGLKRPYAVLITTVGTGVMLAGLGWVVAVQVQGLAVELPRHKQEIRDKVERLKGAGDGPFGELLKMVHDLTEGPAPDGAIPPAGAPGPNPSDEPVRRVVLAQPKESGLARIAESVGPVVEPLATAGLVAVLVVFMLANKEDLRDRFLGLAGHGRVSAASRAMADAGERVGRYLLSVLAVNIAFGTVFAIGLTIIGVPFAVLWGFLTAMLRFIPFLGTWAAVAFPLALSVALSPGWGQPLTVLAFFVVVELTVANVVEPLLFGHGTGVSPIALLVGAAFWAWVWGPIGLLLATPLTVCLVVLGQYVPRLGFLAVLLGNTPALPAPVRLYQRLFSRDEAEAKQRVDEHAAAHGAEAAFDDMVIPALLLARKDRAAGELSPEGEEFALAAVRRIVAAVEPAGEIPAQSATVLAVPAHHPAEEPTLDMLAHLLRSDGVGVEAVSAKVLPSDVADRVAAARLRAVFISVLPPGGLPQAAYLCRMLRKRFPDLTIVVGWWGSEKNFDRMLVKFRRAGASYVTTSLHQSRTQLRHAADVRPAPEHTTESAS
jgi:predicted PurR-regulated permease PerM